MQADDLLARERGLPCAVLFPAQGAFAVALGNPGMNTRAREIECPGYKAPRFQMGHHLSPSGGVAPGAMNEHECGLGCGHQILLVGRVCWDRSTASKRTSAP
jgi:hypothetical protein